MNANLRSQIADYALIGNCRSGAPISKRGSIDWLCWPRFDSPATFAALLDEIKGGAWSIRPLGDFVVTRQGLGFTRLNIPFLLGSMITPNRERAKVYGVGWHLLSGVFFAWLYLVAFRVWDGATWLKGLILGALNGAFLLTVFVTLLPGIHPRMANE